jgi:hypothetical protein
MSTDYPRHHQPTPRELTQGWTDINGWGLAIDGERQ